MDKKQLDSKLKELAREYLSFYKTKNLKIEVNVRAEPEAIKIITSDFR